MSHAVIKNFGYVLAHAPSLLEHHGSVVYQTKQTHPDDVYLTKIKDHLRKFDEVVSYPPNQCYIGNITPEALSQAAQPWYQTTTKSDATGKFGEIVNEIIFYTVLDYVDVFELTVFTEEFMNLAKDVAKSHHKLKDLALFAQTKASTTEEIQTLVTKNHAADLYLDGKLIGCVKAAHDLDINLSSHVMLENLTTKATAVLAGWQIPEEQLKTVEYVIECSEEAIGDINQRGGGNLAKAVAESLGCTNATGIDVRGFCAGPAHAMLQAAAFVQSGIFKNVLVIAGGCVAKLGMNGKDHLKNGMPLLEDVLGSFAVLVSANDGVSPIINTNVVGRHTIGTGSAPQAVMSALISEPLKRNGLTTLDVDKYCTEMQNPEITKPAGAGDVPEANYKMIAALSVKEGWIAREDLPQFVKDKGMPGYAPTQGHIPSGAPFIGHGCHGIQAGTMNNFMLVGKGSLFLGRMTNQFDGVSILIEKNTGKKASAQGSDVETLKELLSDAMLKVAKELTDQNGG